MTTKTMVLGVTFLVLLLLVSWAAVQARQVLVNPDMDGCNGGTGPLIGWTGDYTGVGYAISFPPNVAFSVDDPSCTALWWSQATPYTQYLSLTPGSEAPGLYDFEASFACAIYSAPSGSCTFTVTIDGQDVPLVGGNFKSTSSNSDTFRTLTATNILITNPNAAVIFTCATTSGVECMITRATLTQQGSVVGDPHLVGLDGQRFDTTGKPGSAYSLLSDNDVMVNCLLGRQQVGEHSFISGPVMMIIAVLTPNHTILANAGGHFKDDIGFVSVDGVKVGEGEKIVMEDGVSISFEKISASARDLGLDSDSHIAATSHIEIEGSYRFTVYFVENHFNPLKPEQDSGSLYFRRYLDLSAVLLDDSRAPHGVLGQTHLRGEDKKRSIKDWKMEGKEEDYVLKDGVLGSDFAFNKFRV